MMNDSLVELQRRIGATFHDLDLLQQALVHRSYLNENPGFPFPANERLEFLGDAVLGLVVAEYLFVRFPDLPEGELTNYRTALVRTETLARAAIRLDLGSFLYLGKGERASGGMQRPIIQAGAFEAVVGAIYIDQGLETTREFIHKALRRELRGLARAQPKKDEKSRFQEEAQSRWQQTPVYRTIAAKGPDHAKRFTVEVLVGGVAAGRGHGKSKQSAEQAAARQALRKLVKQEKQGEPENP